MPVHYLSVNSKKTQNNYDEYTISSEENRVLQYILEIYNFDETTKFIIYILGQ